MQGYIALKIFDTFLSGEMLFIFTLDVLSLSFICQKKEKTNTKVS